MNKRVLIAALAASLGATGFTAGAMAAEEVNIYSYRKPILIEPMLNAFTEQTGIKVNAVHAEKGLLERLKNEGRNTPADIVLTVDIGRLADITGAGLTQPVESEVINEAIPPAFRDPQNEWFGLTARARIIVVSKDRVADGEIKTYEDLADPKFAGKICTRSGKHPYMVALIGSMIVAHGEDGASEWLSGLKDNLARKPQGNDRAQVKAISEGVCDVAIINHYYLAKMLQDDEQKEWANSVRVIFPNQDDRGTHMNISGMVMTAHAPDPDNALKLMEFLVSDTAQEMYAQLNSEYPLRKGVAWSDQLKSWGEFKTDDVSLADIAKERSTAIKMVDSVGYDQ
ncbi:MAG: iron ABC transporter substrate-binding protein [marine bacterium B5-7]|nr:MAG: iron ABC transporter substrate-binding protein [marine bacterium B5-7]